MLVLSRKKNERIHIGEGVYVVVADIRGDKVRLGVEAPRSLPVHRGEVYEEIQRQQRAIAAQIPPKKSDTDRVI